MGLSLLLEINSVMTVAAAGAIMIGLEMINKTEMKE